MLAAAPQPEGKAGTIHVGDLTKELFEWLDTRELVPKVDEDGTINVGDLLVMLNTHEAELIRSAKPEPAGRESVGVVGERGSVSWRSERILPVGTILYASAQPDAEAEPIDGSGMTHGAWLASQPYPTSVGAARPLAIANGLIGHAPGVGGEAATLMLLAAAVIKAMAVGTGETVRHG